MKYWHAGYSEILAGCKWIEQSAVKYWQGAVKYWQGQCNIDRSSEILTGPVKYFVFLNCRFVIMHKRCSFGSKGVYCLFKVPRKGICFSPTFLEKEAIFCAWTDMDTHMALMWPPSRAMSAYFRIKCSTLIAIVLSDYVILETERSLHTYNVHESTKMAVYIIHYHLWHTCSWKQVACEMVSNSKI